MGVEGLYKFITKNCSEIYKTVSIYDIKNKSCIIDGMQHIYTQLIYMRSKNKEVITKDGKNISHIHGLINSLTYYFKNGIIPVFIFDGKSPDIKRKKIDERKQILKQNLKKLKELEIQKNNIDDNIKNIQNMQSNGETFNIDNMETTDSILVGTPPEGYNLYEEIQKMQNVQDEYKKIYKKSIVLKDYFITDWIEILEFLGIPVMKATGEADPLCAYILQKNKNIYGIISDDSDMLVFGAPRLMRKSVNQQFTIIELNELIKSINNLLKNDPTCDNEICFTKDNLIEFSLLLGTDYANFNLKVGFSDAYLLLKYYMNNGLKSLVHDEDIEKFNNIKKYYTNLEFDSSIDIFLSKPTWNKPKLLELKKRLLELLVDEDYIDKNNELIDLYYNKYLKKINYYSDFNFRNKNNNDKTDKKSIFDTNQIHNTYEHNNIFNKPPLYPKKYNNYEIFGQSSNSIPIPNSFSKKKINNVLNYSYDYNKKSSSNDNSSSSDNGTQSDNGSQSDD